MFINNTKPKEQNHALYHKLQPNSANTSAVEIVNLKLDPKVIIALIDNEIYFKGYHYESQNLNKYFIK